jgi:hypothetical protein
MMTEVRVPKGHTDYNCKFSVMVTPRTNFYRTLLIYRILYICCMIVREIWRFVHPRKIIFPEGNARGEYDISWVNKSSYLPNIHAINCLLYRINTRLHHRLTSDMHRQYFYYHTKRSAIYVHFWSNNQLIINVVCGSFEIINYLRHMKINQQQKKNHFIAAETILTYCFYVCRLQYGWHGLIVTSQ